ncbi:uncharacterized protein LOC120331269 [Styela clava]
MATSDEKLIRVPVLDVLPNEVGALKVFSHWDRMLTNYLTAVESNRSTEDVSRQINKCAIMGGYLSPDVFSFVEDVDVYNEAMCPARNAECFNCGLRGHFATVCRKAKKSVATVNDLHLTSIIAGIHTSLSRSTITAKIAENPLMALLDSGASQSYIKASVARSLGLTLYGPKTVIALASNESVAQTIGFVDAPLKIGTRVYDAMKFGVVENLCTDIILGQDFLSKHRKVVFEFNGDLDSLYVGKEVCNLASAKVSEPLRIFRFVDDNCKPIAVRSRNYSSDDLKFIKEQIARLLREGIIERYTALDAYPLPRINNIINEVAKGKIYSTIDLRSAYHQIPISDVDRPYTGFEAAGSLYQFCRVPFGVTNGVAVFQRYMDSFIERENLEGTFAYLDNVTIFGDDQPQHDKRLKAFMNAAERQCLTLNKNKSVFSVTELIFLGHLVSHGKIRPDPDHSQPLINLKPPRNGSNLKRCLELFAYYSKWISKFSEKLKPLSTNTSFPLKGKALSFNQLKADLLKACLGCIYEDEPFVIECDASKFAIAAILSQKGRPVAFNSRTLGKSELRHPAVEKKRRRLLKL